MVWGVFLNNQLGRPVTILPDGLYGTATRYIFIEGRNVPIIITDEKSNLPQSWAVGVNDGTNPPYQLGYEGQGQIWFTLMDVNGHIQYTASSYYTKATYNIPW